MPSQPRNLRNVREIARRDILFSVARVPNTSRLVVASSKALLIEIAFARSTANEPLTAPLFAGTSQPEPLLSCGEVTETLAVLQPLCPPSTVTAPSAIELTWTL